MKTKIKALMIFAFLIFLPQLPAFSQNAAGAYGGATFSFSSEENLSADAGLNYIFDINAYHLSLSGELSFTPQKIKKVGLTADFWFLYPRIGASAFHWYAGAGTGAYVLFTGDFSFAFSVRAVLGLEFFPVSRLGVFVQTVAEPSFSKDFCFCFPVSVGVRWWF